MKLTKLIRKPTYQKLNSITESRFGFKIDYEAITLPKATAMRNKIMETVNSIRHSSAIHTAEQDPKYLEMLIVYEGLSRWIDAYKTDKRNLTEGELGQAQAILAAKDMVDTIQDMIEKVGKMQNEQLPALIDSIRDQLDSSQADTFKNQVGQTLATLSQSLGQSREELDSASRSLAGEETGAAPLNAPGGDPALAMGGGDGPGMEAPPDELGNEPDEFGGTAAAVGGTEEMGRERR